MANTCPNCGAPMTLLLFSFVCSKECDKREDNGVKWADFPVPNMPWEWALIDKQPFPEDAEYGWYLAFSHDQWVQNALRYRADAFQAAPTSYAPGWPILDYHRDDRISRAIEYRGTALVFRRKIKS